MSARALFEKSSTEVIFNAGPLCISVLVGGCKGAVPLVPLFRMGTLMSLGLIGRIALLPTNLAHSSTSLSYVFCPRNLNSSPPNRLI